MFFDVPQGNFHEQLKVEEYTCIYGFNGWTLSLLRTSTGSVPGTAFAVPEGNFRESQSCCEFKKTPLPA
jgi:hypothetical protein